MKSDIITIISGLIAIAAMHMGQDTDADVREVYREAAQVFPFWKQLPLLEETNEHLSSD